MMKTVLACTDGSQYASSIYEHAAWAASRIEGQVRVLHVLEREDVHRGRDLTGNLGFDASADLMEELVKLDETQARVARLRGEAVLEHAETQLREKGVSEIDSVQRHGSLVDTVQEFEANSDLVVIGKRGQHADFAKGHLGSNLERVARSSELPVLVASRSFQPVNSFLFAFDGGKSAIKAGNYITRNPLLKGLHCHLVAVGKPDSVLAGELSAAAKGLREAGFEVTEDLIEGEPEEVITREVESRGIDLLVMGAYGHSRIRRFIIGSTTSSLIRDCRIPVLLFR